MSAVRKPWIVYWAFRNDHLSHCTEFLTKIIGSGSTTDFDDNKTLAKSAVGFYGDTLLHLACRQGWLDIVNLLIEVYGYPPDIKDKGRHTPLHYACQYGHIDIVHYLLCHHACDATAATLDHWTPLHYACRYGHMSIVEYLVSLHSLRNVDENNVGVYSSCNSMGFTAFRLAVLHHRYEVALFLLSQAECNPNYFRENVCNTAVHLLLEKKEWSNSECISIIKALVTMKRWDLNSVCGSGGNMALHLSVLYHRYEVRLYLLSQAKCSPNNRNKEGETPVQLLISNHRWSDLECIDIIKSLMKNKLYDSSEDTAPHLSVLCHRYELTLYLLSQTECDPNKRNKKGETPVQLLISKQRVQLFSVSHNNWSDPECIEIIKTLIATKQWDPNSICDSSGDTALHLSVLYHRYELTLYLLSKAECDPIKRNEKSETPVQLFISNHKWSDYKCIDIIKVLIKIKMWDPNSICTSSGDTALHLSVLHHRYKLTLYLFSQIECDPNKRNKKR